MDVVTVINVERAKADVQPLVEDEKLNQIARTRAKEIAHSFSHTRPDGTTFKVLIHDDLNWIGENLAEGIPGADFIKAWMNSPMHRQNILNRKYHKVGTASYGREFVAIFSE